MTPPPPLLLLLLAIAAAARSCHGYQYNASQGPLVTSVIIFGDSIVDPGNNNGLLTLIKANHPPYGKDFFNHEATGRYSNGLIPSDLIAQGLGVKQLLPPYLGVDLSPEELLTGQLAYFDEYRAKLVAIAGEEETEKVIEGALFVVCAGTDDLANTYFTTPFRSVEYDIPSYVELLVSGAEAFLRKVSARGASKIGFVGMPPVGCVPSQRTLGGGLSRDCESKRNQAAQLYNARIEEMIGALNGEPGFRTLVVYLDIYRILDELMERGDMYGFTETTKGCCGTGTIEVTGLCDSRFVSVCDDVSQHVFFDSYHPTERAYRIIVDDIFDHYIQVLI
ncbi:GDSL esterase/lipase EXL1 [Dichanthelium oligosanthes]|uniref:GDSL esterase/lipase EXL1 n=1 Tax=Dichanthelium oligosanthes TaxID=888268 RepID=A0A1E5VK19_9POAL|nr:GDSL esterase/lipase EXL1 [Dichanthelium oligosanthes]